MDSVRVWMYQSLFTNLCGMTFNDWCQTLRDNHFAVPPRYWHRVALLTAGSALNSWYRRREDRLFGERIDRVALKPPLFILGHWRSGTTLLHNLLALDDRYAFPNLYEVFFPHTFLSTEDDRTGLIAPLIPRTRVFDNVAQGLDMPNEDEFATAAASLCSPYMMWAFPRGAEHYERFLTFRDASEREINCWKHALIRFLKKLTIRYERPLLLKSPPHTARIKLLLSLFPDAKFVHVHRDPFTVFRSTRHLNDVLTRSLQFQRSDPDPSRLDDAVIRRYRALHDAYFDERALIPGGDLHELAFEDLERDRGRSTAIRVAYNALACRASATSCPGSRTMSPDCPTIARIAIHRFPASSRAGFGASGGGRSRRGIMRPIERLPTGSAGWKQGPAARNAERVGVDIVAIRSTCPGTRAGIIGADPLGEDRGVRLRVCDRRQRRGARIGVSLGGEGAVVARDPKAA